MTKKRGFTLIELLISMSLMTILITILAQVFGAILAMKGKVEAVSSLAQDSRFLILRLAYDVSRASSITVPAIGSSGQTLTLSIGGQSYVYTLQDGNLNLSVDGGPASALNSVGTTLSDLSFTRTASSGGKSIVQLDTTLVPTVVQAGVQNDARRVITSFVTR